MAHVKRILIVLLVALALAFSAVPAAAEPYGLGEDLIDNVTWE